MFNLVLYKTLLQRLVPYIGKRKFSASRVLNNNYNVSDLRNIGILAHIDAGKTTTTERMLFYSGTIGVMGEVHHGNTVTDYMEQERERGITITAAAVSFDWKDHQFNLIDTPGHIDFTMEVEQSLGVLDGAVVVLDGSAGVEAQTLTVWRQCDSHKIPRLIYINKMDRKDSSLPMSLRSISDKLEVQPLCLQMPVRNKDDKLEGLIDVVNMDMVIWEHSRQGRIYKAIKLKEDNPAWEKTMSARRDIADVLSGYDDELANIIIQSDSLDNIDTTILKKSIKKVTSDLSAFPVLCGSSYKNIGVQTLMDAVVDYLPSPLERNQMYDCFGNDLCAKAFKVQHDKRLGVLTYFRIFSGGMSKAQKIFNIGKEKPETGALLYIPYADEYQHVDEVGKGNVVAISGLKITNSGDIITSSSSVATSAKKKLEEKLKNRDEREKLNIPPYLWDKISEFMIDDNMKTNDAVSKIFGIGAIIPEPVFLCSIEPPSLSYQNSLEIALTELQREDPSLRVTSDEETGQMVLAGMGELHLEVIKQRIISEYKIDAELGPLQISYKETITSNVKDSHVSDNKIGNQKHYVNVTFSAYPSSSKEILKLDQSSPESASNLSHIYPKYLTAIKQGIETALLHGPKLGCPLIDVGVTLHWLEVGRGTSETFVAAATAQCLRKVFSNSDVLLLEPIMYLEILCSEMYYNRIMSDIHTRRAEVLQVTLRGKNKVIECLAPLSELLGFSNNLRSKSSGTASFTMEFHSNRSMSPIDEEQAIKSVRGF